jgi:membrane-associated phospholipid phosphatase
MANLKPATFLCFLLACRLPAKAADRPVSFGQLVPNIISDQKQIWTFPVHAVKRHNWEPVLGVLAITTALIAADPADSRYFRRTNSFHTFNSVVSSRSTSAAIVLAPVSLFAAGLITKDSYARNTALLAGEAVGDAEILILALKSVGGRARPSDQPANSSLGDTWFEGKATRGSFPSGHAIAAFSVATVISRRYPHHRWVPFVAYGLAVLVGFSRVSSSAHFPSDVFMGAALGYSIGRFGVLRQ